MFSFEAAAPFREIKTLKTLVMRDCSHVSCEFLTRMQELCPTTTVICNRRDEV